MQTGIKFFDEHEFQEGNLIVILGGVTSGKSTLATNLAVGLARHVETTSQKPERLVTHFDFERTTSEWKAHVDNLSDGQRLPIEYRNSIDDSGWLPFDLRQNIVVVDPIALATEKERTHEFARSSKRWAVRQKTVVVMMAHLNRELWSQLDSEGWIDPKKLPEWVLEFADQIHYLRRTLGLTLVRAKANGLRYGPHDACTLSCDDHGRLA